MYQFHPVTNACTPFCKMKVVYYLGLLFLLFIGCKPVQNVDIVISNINVIDVKSGKVINNQDVAIIGRLIVDIQNHDEKEYRADQLIYGGEKFLIPASMGYARSHR